jgi:hypothetical protein
MRKYLESGALAVKPGGEALEVRHLPEVVLVQVLPQVRALHECLYEVQPLVYPVRLNIRNVIIQCSTWYRARTFLCAHQRNLTGPKGFTKSNNKKINNKKTKTKQTKANRSKPKQTKANQSKPKQTKANQIELNRIESNQYVHFPHFS